MHSLVENHPKYRQAVQEAKQMRERAARFSLEAARRKAEHDLATNRYRAETEAALVSGGPLPDPPPAFVPLDQTMGAQLRDSAVFAPDVVRAALREIAPEVGPQLLAVSGELEASIREVLDQLKPLLAEANRLRETQQTLLTAERAGTGVPSGELRPFSLPELLGVVTAGRPVVSTELPRTVGGGVFRSQPVASDAAFDPSPPDADTAIARPSFPSSLNGRR